MKGKCLVIGGGGFIGSHLAEGLLSDDYEVRIFDISNFDKRNLISFIHKVEICEGDFSNPIDIASALRGIDFVYHLVSSTIPSNSVLNPSYDIESNVIPSIILLQQCIQASIQKIVFISSGGTVYGIPEHLPLSESHPSNPISSYGIAKRTIESYISLYNKLWGLNACIFRLSNPYGERQNPLGKQGVIPIFLHKAFRKEIIQVWGNGEVIRDYIYINDVTSALIKAIKIETPELVYNLGSGVGTSINHILDFIKEQVNPSVKINYLESRDFDVPENVLDITLLLKRFELKNQINLETGLSIMMKHFQDNGYIGVNKES
ncbi:NAD-dependent epimerase/dehydratase family protein [Dyadobacter psychrotolerans]|uniref:NAD-dependent epimerase/dehydratase family protein n=1 Tax=Dyadobacter psychrotolerans TaxID=2541721 RepID=A0A4R5DQ63_9BACT|nr:NAD-dependent epimerase/dehydratase family protein [Dyadobacter psychrotolerans]TDE13135.1 NAD-dependent epimerase/dehydratase family protein [Dyadobacter psychrotolerans]